MTHIPWMKGLASLHPLPFTCSYPIWIVDGSPGHGLQESLQGMAVAARQKPTAKLVSGTPEASLLQAGSTAVHKSISC